MNIVLVGPVHPCCGGIVYHFTARSSEIVLENQQITLPTSEEVL
jgi:hypothetical protein